MANDRRVIFNADDFGLTPRVNEAVVSAHREGVLSSASLMVAEPHAEAAVRLARAECPDLEIGLHLVLCQGRPVLPPDEIRGLCGRDGRFPESPAGTGLRLFFAPWLRPQIRREVAAQVERFRALVGRPPAHVNGHLNIHVHPTVLPIVLDQARAGGIPVVRLPREPAATVLAVDPRAAAATRWNGFIFERLSRRAAPRIDAAGLGRVERCFGVLRPFEMTEAFVLGLLDRLGPGATEIYLHPGHPAHAPDGGGGGRDPEWRALVSPRLRERLAALGVAFGRHDHAVAADPKALAAPRHAAPEQAG